MNDGALSVGSFEDFAEWPETAGLDILFLHCAGPQGDGEGSNFLTRFLRAHLEPHCKVLIPHMPDPEDPHYKPWKKKLERLLRDRGDRELFIVGHSLGASVALKYLSEKPPMKAIAGLFLIGAVYWGLDDWKVSEYSFERNFHRHLGYIPNIFFYHSKDDAVVPVSHLWHFAVALPDARIREFEHEGHLYVKGIPQLLADIKSVKK
jgi:predicted alpha/beta hydrolase family esterase